MSASTSLYRKYRSQTFDELVGQEPVVRTLKNAIASGRISHAYLFTGPRGVGKTSAARLLARAANCLSEEEDKPCNECANCTAANRDIATDLIEIDAASNTGVDNIREVIERANFAPSVWNTKFYIVDEVHMLSISAFNALLKTLEEPPPHTAFILATTEVHKVPATVASRCQRFDFRRVPLEAMVARLEHICKQEDIPAEREALELVARHATGSLRDAESLLDQLRVFAEGSITLESVQSLLGTSGSKEVAEFADSLIGGDLATGLRHINRVLDDGLDLRQFNRQIVEYLRGLMLVKTGAASGESSMLDVTEEIKQQMRSQVEHVTVPDLLRWLQAFAEADAGLRSTAYRQLPLEMALGKAVFKPAETTEQFQVRERGFELAPGVEQVAATPRVQPQPRQPDEQHAPQPTARQTRPDAVAKPARTPEPEAPPPPIHMEMNLPTPPVDDVAQATTDAEEIEHVAEIQSERAATDGDELHRLQGLWVKIVDQINARSKNVASVFRDSNLVRPHSISANVVTLSFRYPIQADRCRKEPWRSVIEQAVSRVLGYQVRVESILFNEGKGPTGGLNGGNGPSPEGGAPRSARPTQSPYETTRGKAAMNIFGIDKFEDPQ
jgi:DNA polymerase-3 subunit gamma/tau